MYGDTIDLTLSAIEIAAEVSVDEIIDYLSDRQWILNYWEKIDNKTFDKIKQELARIIEENIKKHGIGDD